MSTDRVSEWHAFFVAVNSSGGRTRLVNPFTPFQREFVVVATSGQLVLLVLRRPGVFRASIEGTLFDGSPEEAELQWRDGTLFVNRMPYEPISFHQEDAQAVAEDLGLSLIGEGRGQEAGDRRSTRRERG